MYKKNFLSTFFAACLLFGCNACTPELDGEPKTDSPDPVTIVDTAQGGDSQPTEEEECDRSWVTWTDCGGAVGDHACDFTFKDQNNDDWSLYDQRGKLTLLDFSTMWCSVCNNIAAKGDEFEATYAWTGTGPMFQWITVLVDDSAGDTVELVDVQAWIDNHNISTTVLAGDRSIIDVSATNGYPISSWPTLVLVGEEMEILAGWHGWNESWVSTAIEEHLN